MYFPFALEKDPDSKRRAASVSNIQSLHTVLLAHLLPDIKGVVARLDRETTATGQEYRQPGMSTLFYLHLSLSHSTAINGVML